MRKKFPFFSIASLGVSVFFFYVWWERYLRIDFNELGRYWDSEQQLVYTEAGFIWGIPAVLFLIPGLLGIVRWHFREKQ